MGMPLVENDETALLLQRREQIRARFQELEGRMHLLKVDMDTPLVDHEGFPRRDIDVWEARKVRTEMIMLRNDYNELMNRAEQILCGSNPNSSRTPVYARPRTPPERESTFRREPIPIGRPFAYIKEISPGSPAEQAGLQVGDEIVMFGNVHIHNHDRLRALPAEIAEDQVVVKVHRHGRQGEVHLTLIPRRGSSVGAYILPL